MGVLERVAGEPVPGMTVGVYGTHPLDPSRARPWQPMIQGIKGLERRAAPGKMLAETVFGPGIRSAGSAGAIDTLLETLTQRGHQWQATILDNATLRMHFLHQKKSMPRAFFDLPIQQGFFVTMHPGMLRDMERTAWQTDVRRAQFVARGQVYRTPAPSGKGWKWEQRSWMQRMTAGLADILTVAETPEDYMSMTKRARKFIYEKGFQDIVYAGAKKSPLTMGEASKFMRRGSMFDILQASLVGVFTGPGIDDPRVMGARPAGLSSWPWGKFGESAVFEGERVLNPMKWFLGETAALENLALGHVISHRGIKPESALKGNLGTISPGALVPFGATSDPARVQALTQRWAIAALAGRGRHTPSISTPLAEAAKKHASTLAGTPLQFTREARMALVLDPAFERAVAASGGGAVISPKLAESLAADITQYADYESRAWNKMIERGGGKAIEKLGIGTPIITSFGTKHRIAGITQMAGADLAIGWSTFLKGKAPEAVRESIVRDIADQVGAWSRGRKIEGRGFVPFTEKQLAARRENISGFMQRMAEVVGGGTKVVGKAEYGVAGLIPTLQIGSEAKFGQDELQRILEASEAYNERLKIARQRGLDMDLQPVRGYFAAGSFRAAGRDWSSMFIGGSVMRRLESQRVVTKAVGNWVRPMEGFPKEIDAWLHQNAKQVAYALAKGQRILPGPGDKYIITPGGEYLQTLSKRFHPGGAKLRMRDITNVRLWQTESADKLARLYEAYVKSWQKETKQEVVRTFGPMVLGKDMAELAELDAFKTVGAPKPLDKLQKYTRVVSGGKGYNINELSGTIFEAGSPLRKQGQLIQLGEELGPIHIGGFMEGGRMVGGMKTSQLYLPSLETYRAVAIEAEQRLQQIGQTDVYMDELVRRHQRLWQEVTKTKPTTEEVEKAAREYYNTFAKALGGKTGFMSYLASARMAHSGYLGLVPGGVLPPLDPTERMPGIVRAGLEQERAAMRKLGTALENPFVVEISESTAKEMGVFDFFRRRSDTAFGRLTAYPATGPTMESVYQFKMVSDSRLGQRQLRLSNLVALSMFRDFDMDKAAVTFMTGNIAQQRMENFYRDTVLPRMREYKDVLQGDPEWANLEGQLKKELENVKHGGDRVRYETMMNMAVAKSTAVTAAVDQQLANKYMTKVLTPVMHWYLEPFREYAALPSVLTEIEQVTGLTRNKMKDVGGLIALIKQQAIVKGKGIEYEAVKALVHEAGTAIPGLGQAGGKFDRAAFEASATRISESLVRLAGVDPAGKTSQEVYKAVSGAIGGQGGEWHIIADQARRLDAAKGYLGVVQTQLREKMEAGGKLPMLRNLLTKRLESEAAFHDVSQAFIDSFERAKTGGLKHATALERQLLDTMHFARDLGMDTSQQIVAIEQAKVNAQKSRAVMEEMNEALKRGAKEEGVSILDRVTRWWRDIKTPFWQKAGVITGAAIVLGAAAKSLLTGGYGPPEISSRSQFAPPHRTGYTPSGGEFDGPYASPDMFGATYKPGGIWGGISHVLGGEPSDYGVEAGRPGMPDVKPVFGPRMQVPAAVVDVGPGISSSDQRAMILSGPPISGQSMLPPASQAASSIMESSNLPFHPDARPVMDRPDYLRQGPMERAYTLSVGQPLGMGDSVGALTPRMQQDLLSMEDLFAGSNVELFSEIAYEGKWDIRNALDRGIMSSF